MLKRVACFGLAVLLSACASPIANQRLDGRSAPILAADATMERAEDVFVVLAFSGGGTRSAAFSYGVLETLRDTMVSVNGRSRRLLDEVDVITSVSGGSYTAAYYGLFGDRIFSDFEAAFLKRDVEGELTSLLLNPIAMTALAVPGVNRSDVAASWLDDNVFKRQTFAKMRQPGRPFVILNASDINTGMTFSFLQQQFDFLCSDIDSFPVARAVMASSAVPGYFAPVAVKNFDDNCAARQKTWVAESLSHPDIYGRNYQVARAVERYQRPQDMPVVRLVDGGITDNLGVRGSMMSPIMHNGNVEDMAGAFSANQLDKISKVLVIVANAQIYEDYAWSRSGREPGIIGSLSASFDSAIGIMNSETVGLARSGFMQWADRVNRRPSRTGQSPVEVRFAALTFDDIRDDAERRRFNAVPTSLSLSSQQVDEVRDLARRVLSGNAEYRAFVGSLH